MFYASLALLEIGRHIRIHGNTLPNACVNEYGWCSLFFVYVPRSHSKGTSKAFEYATSILYQSLSCFSTHLSPAASSSYSSSFCVSRDMNAASSALSTFEISIIHSIEIQIFSISLLLFINPNRLNVLSWIWEFSTTCLRERNRKPRKFWNIVEQIKNL